MNDLMAYWQNYPPTHVLVAAYLMGGSKRLPSKRRRENYTGGNPSNNLDELTQAVYSAGGTMNNKLPHIYKT